MNIISQIDVQKAVAAATAAKIQAGIERSELANFIQKTTRSVVEMIDKNAENVSDFDAYLENKIGAIRPQDFKFTVFEDCIICLEDGERVKYLTRHVKEKFGMTAEDYKKRHNLPNDYPMCVPGLASQRAKKSWLVRMKTNTKKTK